MKFPTDSMLRLVLTNNESLITRNAGNEDFVVHAVRLGQNIMKILAYGNGTAVNPHSLGYRAFKNYKIVVHHEQEIHYKLDGQTLAQQYQSKLIQITGPAPHLGVNDFILFKDMKAKKPVLVRIKQVLSEGTFISDVEISTNTFQPVFFLHQ